MNCTLEFEKYFMESRDRDLKDREVKIKREIEELFLEPIIESKDNMNRFEKKKRPITPIKKTWYDWLINSIPEPIRVLVVSKVKLIKSL